MLKDLAYVERESLYGKRYVLAGKKCHFYRYCDSGFADKWTGFWYFNKKLIDYFTIKAGEDWLSPASMKEFYYDGAIAEHRYANGVERIVVAENDPCLAVEVEADAPIELEIGVNMRWKWEGYTEKEYYVEESPYRVAITSNLGTIDIRFSSDFTSIRKTYRVHYPGGEPYRILQLNIQFDVDELEFNIWHGRGRYRPFGHIELEKRAHYHKILKKSVKIDFEEDWLKRLYCWAVLNLEFLIKEYNRRLYVFAGYPWSLEMWTRDTCWMLLAFEHLEWNSRIERILDFYAHLQETPSFVIPEESTYGENIDSAPLLLYVASRYYYNRGKAGKLSRFGWLISKILEADIDRDGLLEAGFGEGKLTWMDTLKREGKPAEVNALWIRGLELFCKATKTDVDTKELIDKFRKAVVHDGVITDTSKRTFVTPNSLIPILLNLVDYETAVNTLRKLEKECGTHWGIATIPKQHPEYRPDGHHIGAVWWITNFWYMAAKEYVGENAYWLLRRLREQVDNGTIGGFPECIRSDNGQEIGCGMRGWSAAWFIIYVNEYLLPYRVQPGKYVIRRMWPKLGKKILGAYIIRR